MRKTVIATAIMMASLAMSATVVAQEDSAASKRNTFMQSLDLSEEQKADLRELRSEAREARQAHRAHVHDRMTAILTPEQLETYQAKRSEWRDNKQERYQQRKVGRDQARCDFDRG